MQFVASVLTHIVPIGLTQGLEERSEQIGKRRGEHAGTVVYRNSVTLEQLAGRQINSSKTENSP